MRIDTSLMHTRLVGCIKRLCVVHEQNNGYSSLSYLIFMTTINIMIFILERRERKKNIKDQKANVYIDLESATELRVW